MSKHQNPSSQSTSYAEQLQMPTKEHAIVIDAVEGLKVEDYAIAIGSIITPIKLKYISRISQGRVCLFLDSKATTEELLSTHPKVKVGNSLLEIRPLVAKTKRVLISNVSPIIPTSLIYNELAKKGITSSPRISDVRAAISDPGYGHVGSFRKQMYLKQEDIEKLPERACIFYEDLEYWIYFSTDKLTCFLCKEEGHLAKNCTNDQNQQQNLNIAQVKDTTEFPPMPPLHPLKRHAQSSDSSGASEKMTNLNSLNRIQKNANKKKRGAYWIQKLKNTSKRTEREERMRKPRSTTRLKKSNPRWNLLENRSKSTRKDFLWISTN